MRASIDAPERSDRRSDRSARAAILARIAESTANERCTLLRDVGRRRTPACGSRARRRSTLHALSRGEQRVTSTQTVRKCVSERHAADEQHAARRASRVGRFLWPRQRCHATRSAIRRRRRPRRTRLPALAPCHPLHSHLARPIPSPRLAHSLHICLCFPFFSPPCLGPPFAPLHPSSASLLPHVLRAVHHFHSHQAPR
jgi:hypothetical protein